MCEESYKKPWYKVALRTVVMAEASVTLKAQKAQHPNRDTPPCVKCVIRLNSMYLNSSTFDGIIACHLHAVDKRLSLDVKYL